MEYIVRVKYMRGGKMIALEVFKQLSNETRLRLVALLLNHELCVCELEEILNIRQANISKHLIKLKEVGMVDVRREKQRGFYFLTEAFYKQEDLVSFIKEMIIKEAVLTKDYQAFIEHEETKDQNIYICNMDKRVA